MVGALAVKLVELRGQFDPQAVGNSLYGLKNMSTEHIEVRRLIVSVTGQVSACQGLLDDQSISNALYGLNGMTGEYPEVRALLLVLATKITECHARIRPEGIGSCLYGLRGMSSEYPEVRKTITTLVFPLLQFLPYSNAHPILILTLPNSALTLEILSY